MNLQALVVVLLVLTACGGERDVDRVSVAWESIELSDDRRTITVTTSYPLAASCVKEADGVDVRVQGEVAVISAWMRGPDLPLPPDTDCTAECGLVTQSVTLAEPLPDEVSALEPAPGSVDGCW
ncbi:MAG: hypothetical protein M3535_05160 [Actinomycetota bacterium]|jgi:hypothetical protein|nr:hypothetical protein [Actinomycetota bacterium]MDQ3352983.1 hypothetical protein [Actinomycetota bacterium]